MRVILPSFSSFIHQAHLAFWALALMMLSSLALFSAAPVQAEECIQSAHSTPEMVVCAEEDLSRVDGDLRTVFSGMQRFLDPTGKKKLLEAETAWLQYRDNQCDFETDGETNTDMKQLFNAGCKVKMTEERVKAMYEHYEQLKRKKTIYSEPNHPLSQTGGPYK